jgi:hypothetical protein
MSKLVQFFSLLFTRMVAQHGLSANCNRHACKILHRAHAVAIMRVKALLKHDFSAIRSCYRKKPTTKRTKGDFLYLC